MNRKIPNEELRRLNEEAFKKAEKIPVVVVLDNVRSAQNVGSVFRSSDAFRIEKIYLCGITAKPPSREINKTALGATRSVDWEHMDSAIECIEKLKRDGMVCAAVEQAENSEKLGYYKPETGRTYALVFGNEVEGVDQKVVDICDFALEVPQFGTKHSLNISVCAGVVLWEWCRNFIAALQ